MCSQQVFYNSGTERKLKVVQSYLNGYLQVMSRQNFETIYVDAFAGSGENPIKPIGKLFEDSLDADDVREGSALRALKLPRKFSQYVFIEASKSKLDTLKDRVDALGLSGLKVDYRKQDANAALEELCPYLSQPNVRAVVFLDPFGNQVGWSLLEKLAQTKHIDLWYLFPSMLGVYRQIGNADAKMTREQIDSLDYLFGLNDWRKAFISEAQVTDLFGEKEISQKVADVEDITRFMIKCMGNIFEGGVQKKWLPLGRNGAHWYSLIFAMANPGQRAQKIGHDIANHLLTRS